MARTSKSKNSQTTKSAGRKPAARRSATRRAANREKSIHKKAIFYLVSLIFLFFASTRLGPFGVFLYNVTELFIGSTAYFGMALFLLYLVLNVFKKELFRDHPRLILGVILIYAGALLIVQSIFTFNNNNLNDAALWNVIENFKAGNNNLGTGAGLIGWCLYTPSLKIFSSIGVYVIAGILIIVGLFVAYPDLISRIHSYHLDKQEDFKEAREERKEIRAEKLAKKQLRLQEKEEKARQKAELKEAQSLEEVEEEVVQEAEEVAFEEVFEREVPIMGEFDRYPEEEEFLDFEPEEFPVEELERVEEKKISPNLNQPLTFVKLPSQLKKEREAASIYHLPTTELLEKLPIQSQEKEKVQVRKNIKILEDTFQSFGISATVESAVVGPSITKYEIKLATGVRVNRVANLGDDLALALAAKDVRIEVPIPGKSLIGVEIPNKETATVGFREMWEAAKTDPEKLLEIPLGKALDGTVKTFDLSKMPHLLVAGSTGSGKSVAVNGIIASILMKALPSQVKFLMIDPKMVELSVYNDIPQLLIPVVTNPRKASRALQRVVDEMERRYELFSRRGVRNITGYNEKIEKFNAESEEKEIPLPLIVVIVDELADLMMVASKEVEDAIIRLGQKARAAGIHMILATQRPSVDVISGLIKANVPSRVAFAVSSGTDSRTILDANGAEKLLGRGDMLFKPIDENHALRLQGAFLSDEDVERLVDYIKDQRKPEYDDSFDPGEAAEDDNRAGYAGSENSSDPLFEEAKSFVITAQKASTAQLQRTLKVGFNRATDLMNELEAAGVVGPAKGTTPRKVLMNLSGDLSPEE